VKTDKVDARVLAELGASGFIAEVWVPGPELRALRRRVAHRARLVSEKRRHRNQVHAVLARNLVEVAVTDLFGKKGRRALRQIELPDSEREQVDATLRLHDAVEAELAVLERSLSKIALASAEVRRLMTIPGIGAVTALGLLALIGDIGRFPTSRHLVGYLGLDPRVRQSGDRQARTGRISRQGQARARSLLVEASLGAVKTPGPLRAFNARVRARRGAQVAAVATARKLAVLIWHLLASGEDYRYEAPSLTRRKLRALEQRAGRTEDLTSLAGWKRSQELERELLARTERIYEREVAARART